MSKFTDTNGLSYNCFRPAVDVSSYISFGVIEHKKI